MKVLVIVTLIFGFTIVSVGAQAQNNIVAQADGRWKLADGWTITASEKKDFFVKEMHKDEPCTKKAVFLFSPKGKINIENTCPSQDDDNTPVFAKYEVIGKNKIKVWVVEDDDPQIYELKYEGNKMIWAMRFPTGLKNRPDDITTLVYVFEKS